MRIDHRDVYKTLWKCRDFELSTLWQRSIMLGVFMVASYTGYGAWVLQTASSEANVSWECTHLVSIGICWIGIIFASLWIMMSKGSKAWYERYEAAISAFADRECSSAFEFPSVKMDAGFKICWQEETEQRVPHVDCSLTSVHAGGFSPSKTAILIGIVSLAGWVLLMAIHLLAICLGQNRCTSIVNGCALEIALLLIVCCAISVALVWSQGRSPTI